MPAYSLAEALRISGAIVENYAGDPTKPLNVASALELSPSASNFRQLTGASIAYGLTVGGYNATEIAVTDIARRIHSPLEEGQDIQNKRAAFLKPRVISEFLSKYDGHAIPKEQIAQNVLVEMGVPKERSNSIKDMIVDGAKDLGLLSEIKGKTYVNLDGHSDDHVGSQNTETTEFAEEFVEKTDQFIDAAQITNQPSSSALAEKVVTRVFITHGKNKEFVEPIKKLLKFGGMEAVVSVEKQSISKPVPDKVMDDMRECHAAIIHVDGESTLLDQEANTHIILNPNVLIEIGAAMALYKRKFILLVKDGVKLPSNLQGLFEVRYPGETMDSDATIRLLEAINELKK